MNLKLKQKIINKNIFGQEKNEVANDPISINYNIEKIYDYNKIIWGFEFINEKTIIFTDKKGKMYLIKDSKIQEISGVPEIYYMGQGGLMDIELHPKFNINNKIFLKRKDKIIPQIRKKFKLDDKNFLFYERNA